MFPYIFRFGYKLSSARGRTANPKLLNTFNFMVAPCINNIKHFIVQLMHTNYKILRLLK